MSIKQLCFDAQAQLHDQHGIAVRRTHLYELLAARPYLEPLPPLYPP